MNQSDLTKLAIALGMLYGVYKFVPGQHGKAAAIAVGAVLIAKRVPILKDQLA